MPKMVELTESQCFEFGKSQIYFTWSKIPDFDLQLYQLTKIVQLL